MSSWSEGRRPLTLAILALGWAIALAMVRARRGGASGTT